MPTQEGFSRRRFVQKAGATLGAAALGAGSTAQGAPGGGRPVAKSQRLPREVWVASISQNKMEAKILELDERLFEVLPPLHELLSLKVDDKAYLELEPKQKRERTFEAIRDLLIRESQKAYDRRSGGPSPDRQNV